MASNADARRFRDHAETAGRADGWSFANPDRIRECVHCGLCLQACPTYVELGTEMDSPRGRIYLMRELEAGGMSLAPEVLRPLDLCLGCRACETACPSGVRYGELIESTRAAIERSGVRPRAARLWRRGIAWAFSDSRRFGWLLLPVRVLQAVKIWPLVRPLVPFAQFVPRLRAAASLPAVSRARGEERARVGLLAGCVARVIYGNVLEAAVRVLTYNGVTVIVPPEAGCCGALNLHGGQPEQARRFAAKLISAFGGESVDAVVVTAAGCGAAMKEYGHLLRGTDLAPEASKFQRRVRDVSEYLYEIGIRPPSRPLAIAVTYHDACHLLHAQHVSDQPRTLLRAITGLDPIELPESDFCCGSAGTYNLTEPAMAWRLLERKVRNIAQTGASCVATGNPGCSLQIEAGFRSTGLSIRVAHPVELLDEAYRLAGNY